MLHEKLYLELSPVVSVAWPGRAAREFFGHGDTTLMFQAFVYLKF